MLLLFITFESHLGIFTQFGLLWVYCTYWSIFLVGFWFILSVIWSWNSREWSSPYLFVLFFFLIIIILLDLILFLNFPNTIHVRVWCTTCFLLLIFHTHLIAFLFLLLQIHYHLIKIAKYLIVFTFNRLILCSTQYLLLLLFILHQSIVNLCLLQFLISHFKWINCFDILSLRLLWLFFIIMWRRRLWTWCSTLVRNLLSFNPKLKVIRVFK